MSPAEQQVRQVYPKATTFCCRQHPSGKESWSIFPERWECSESDISGPLSYPTADEAWAEAARLLDGGEPKENPFFTLGKKIAKQQNEAFWKAFEAANT